MKANLFQFRTVVIPPTNCDNAYEVRDPRRFHLAISLACLLAAVAIVKYLLDVLG